jgi:hypothetical protein
MLYAGREPTPGPLPRVAPPAQLMAVGVPMPVVAITPVMPATVGQVTTAAPTPTVIYSRIAPSQDKRYVPGALPDSTIREEFRDSGKWIAR